MDRAQAIAVVTRQTQAGVYPLLTIDEIAALVDDTTRYVVWVPSTAYTEGDVVIPTVRNGHRYRCLVSGTSDSTEPWWPLYANPDWETGTVRPYWHGYIGDVPGSVVGDGSTIIWQEFGPDDVEQFDVKSATRKGWLLKASKASPDYNKTLDTDVYNSEQVFDHCLEMAKLFPSTRLI